MKKLFLSFPLLIVLLTVFFLLFFSKPRPQVKKTIRGSFSFQPATFYATKTNDPFTVRVVGDSGNFPVIGYDLDITYDKKNLQLVKVENTKQDDFDFFNKEKGQEIFITGMKKIQEQEKIILKNTPLVELSFKFTGQEKSTMKLNFEKGSKKESNLVTEDNIDILDSVGVFAVFAGKKLNLKLNEKNDMAGLAITLTAVTKPKTSCRDCFETAKVVVRKADMEKKLEFKTGGIAGVMIDNLTAFDYKFVLEEVTTDGVLLSVYEDK